MKNLAKSILGLAVLSLSQCVSRSNLIPGSSSQSVFTPVTAVTKLHFPRWLDAVQDPKWTEPKPLFDVEQIEVRRAPNLSGDELLFAAVDGYSDRSYSYEVDKSRPKPQFSLNIFAVNLSAATPVRAATQQEWESGSRVTTRPRYIGPNGNDSSSGEIEYRQKRYPKLGQYWGKGQLSPSGKWLAVFSYSGKKRPPDLLFGGGDPLTGDVFWQVFDTATGNKVFEWQAKHVKTPTSFDNIVIWLNDRYLLLQENEGAEDFVVVTMPAFTPEENPVTIQFPSRRDSSGQLVPAGSSNEAWTPLVPLTKEQAAKLTAPSETDITEVRLLGQAESAEVLFAIREETENHVVNRAQRDGAGDYNYRLFNTWYYALSLNDLTQTRFTSKEEWNRGRALWTTRSENPTSEVKETITSKLPPHRQVAKTGKLWGSPPSLSGREWLAIFSYDQEGDNARNTIYVDLYDQELGDKLLMTTLRVSVSPHELFKRALFMENGYVLLPLNASLDSFALWRLPGGV